MEIIQELLQDGRAGGVAQFFERLVLDLADAFAGHLEDIADLFEGAVVAVIDAKTEADDAFLAGGEGF